MDAHVVVHCTTTCDEHGVYVTKDSCELVELAWVILGPRAAHDELARQSVLIRPENTPITPLCTSLSGLSWDQVERGTTFENAISALEASIRSVLLSKGLSFTFVALNSWDLRVQLPREARDKQVQLPPWLAHPRVFDLRTEYARWQARHPEAAHHSVDTLSGMCTALGVGAGSGSKGFVIAPPRRAGEDAALAAELLRALALRSLPRDAHPDVLSRPLDAQADMRAFLAQKSTVVYLSNLPSDTTQSELESWFTQHGARPIAFYTLVRAISSVGIEAASETGFAIFATHEEAVGALGMSGRALNDRAVEISPSSQAVLSHAQQVLTPFPASKNRPRPGDWTCPSCGFSNFQRRTACLRCQYPNSRSPVSVTNATPNTNNSMNGGSLYVAKNNHHNTNYHSHPSHHYHQNHHQQQQQQQQQHYGHNGNGNGNGSQVPFRAGDWTCTNEECSYHNFAKNMTCLRCGGPRPPDVPVHRPHGHHHHHQHHQSYNNGFNNGLNALDNQVGQERHGYRTVSTGSFRPGSVPTYPRRAISQHHMYSIPVFTPGFGDRT
uniref:ARAD1B11484p n=1 Tax=Blastobotrys adeninivorans TaxID=409370 RepID=A0A060T5Y3_BLAAD